MDRGNPFTAVRRLADTLIVTVMVALFSMAATGADLPSPNAAYSADSLIRVGGVELEGRVYHDRGLERREITIQGMEQVIIRRADLNHVYVAMPAMGMGMEMDLDSTPYPTPEEYLEGLDATPMGQERVAGLEATKYRLTGTDPSGGAFDGFVWITDDGITLRLEGTVTAGGRAEEVLMELDNVEPGPQDPALFDRPDNVTFMPMNPALGGNLPLPGFGAAAE
ncbi:MAG: hypothetical protein GVY13_04800 [Alphaproteobacteria bacterium]|nr:hypothetical protein [Alphaproteobacteria bacterium]